MNQSFTKMHAFSRLSILGNAEIASNGDQMMLLLFDVSREKWVLHKWTFRELSRL